MVLTEYEDLELYEECAIIKKALEEYESKYVKNKITETIIFPFHLREYNSKAYQDQLLDLNIEVKKETARDKATLIKLRIPIK